MLFGARWIHNRARFLWIVQLDWFSLSYLSLFSFHLFPKSGILFVVSLRYYLTTKSVSQDKLTTFHLSFSFTTTTLLTLRRITLKRWKDYKYSIWTRPLAFNLREKIKKIDYKTAFLYFGDLYNHGKKLWFLINYKTLEGKGG